MPSEFYRRGRNIGMAAASALSKSIRTASSKAEVGEMAARRLRALLRDNPDWFTQWNKWREGFIDGFVDRSADFR